MAVNTALRLEWQECEAAGSHLCEQKGKVGTPLASSFSPFDSVWALSLWDGVFLIQDGTSLFS